MKRFFFGTYFFIIAAVVLTIFGMDYMVDIYIEHKYPEVFVKDEQNIRRGTFYLFEQELLKVPEKQYQEVIDRLQPQFGYPITLKTIESLQLSSEALQAVETNRILVRDEGNMHLKRIGTSNSILSMGPYQYLNFKITEITGLIAMTALSLGVMILCWTTYFWRKLNRVKEATFAFGQGDFSARAVVPKFSSLTVIASAFNDMAAHIERLISSHKQLVNGVSHELRTPISRIRFGLEGLRTAEEKEKMKQLSEIRHDVDELDDLVSELLSYAKFERMENQISLQDLPLLPWLREYMRVAQEISKVPLEFSWQKIEEDSLVKFDPRQLERAIHNLLQNGNRFAALFIQVRLIKNAGWISIIVEDDGPGIAEADRTRVFDPFVRLDSSRNRKNGGYGLGLSIVREIARSHNGTISIQKSSLGGAAFHLNLPIGEGAS